MNIGILKRIEAIEKRVKLKKVPDLIMINYNWKANQWGIKEQFMTAQAKEKYILLEHYKDYVIPAEFEGTILLDLLDCPEEYIADLFSIKAKDLKKEVNAKGCGLKLEYAFDEEGRQPTSKFNITVIQYTN